MNIELNETECRIASYACQELQFKRLADALDAEGRKQREVAQDLRAEAHQLERLAVKLRAISET